jgi:dihydroneopterin aldolase
LSASSGVVYSRANGGNNRTHMADSQNSPDLDRIFVHDFVLPVRIGAFDSEHERPQQVRFNIDACIARPAQVPERLPEVFSYDLITDGIRAIIAQGHIHLVETLAERIAAMVLTHSVIRQVTVRIEKLEVIPGSAVGVQITRGR